jgi:hypothetical protein
MSPFAQDRSGAVARARSAAGSLSRQFAIAVGLAIAPVLIALVVFGWINDNETREIRKI